MTDMLLILLLIVFLLFTIVVLSIGFMVITMYRRRLDMDEYALHLEQDPNKARELLTKMIEDALLDWAVYHVRTEEESYINETRQEECLIWVIDKVVRETTPVILDQINVGYPSTDRESYINIVKKVAMLHVMKFCITQNASVMADAKDQAIQNINIDF